MSDWDTINYLFIKYMIVFIVMGNIIGASYWIRRWKKDKDK